MEKDFGIIFLSKHQLTNDFAFYAKKKMDFGKSKVVEEIIIFWDFDFEASIFTIFSFSLREKEWRNVLIELFLSQEFDKSFDD